MQIPTIRIDDPFDMCVYFCYMLDEFGNLSDSIVSEIVLSLECVNYFELMTEVGVMEKKGIVVSRRDNPRSERVYSLMPSGKKLVEEFAMVRIPRSIREHTAEIYSEVARRIALEKEIRCHIIYDYERKRYDLNVIFLNEINGETMLDIMLYAPDEKRAKEMKERFLSRPSFTVSRIMNMFLKDNYISGDR